MPSAKFNIVLPLDPLQVVALDRLADKAFTTRSALIRSILAAYLDKESPGWRESS